MIAPIETSIPNSIRNWSIWILLWSFIWLLSTIIYIFYDAIELVQYGISFKLALDCINLLIMVWIATLGIITSEFKTIVLTKLYFYVISIYAPFNIFYLIIFDDNTDIHKNTVIFLGFIMLNIVLWSFYILWGYKLYRSVQLSLTEDSFEAELTQLTEESGPAIKTKAGVMYKSIPIETTGTKAN